jgi:hypothetical protein
MRISILCVSPNNIWMPEPIFMKLGMCIMAIEPISGAYFINPSHQSVCLYVYPSCRCKATARLSVSLHSVLGNGWVNVPTATNTRNNSRIVGRVIFYAVRVIPKGSLWVCLCIPPSLLGNNSVNTFPRQWRIGGVVFYAVRVVSKESRRLFPELLVFFKKEIANVLISCACMLPAKFNTCLEVSTVINIVTRMRRLL